MTVPRGSTAAAGLMVLATAGCGENSAAPGTDGESTRPGWERVAESPLSPREAPLAIAVDGRFLVVGGSDAAPCPPYADCVAGPDPLRDGAAYDPATGAWSTIAEAPVPVAAGPDTAVVVGSTVYLLTTLPGAGAGAGEGEGGAGEGGEGEGGEGEGGTGTSFLAYDAAADRWATLTPPVRGEWVNLTAAGGRVVAYRGSHEDIDSPQPEPADPLPADLVYDAATDTWAELPPDPLAPSFDRRLVGTDDGAVLLASALVPNPGVDPPVVDAARLDLATGTWTELPGGDLVSGYGVRRAGDLLVSAVEGSADGGEIDNWGRDIPYGGILDPATGTWSELPDRPGRDPLDGFVVPADLSGERTVVSGAWVLDVPTLSWSRVPELPVEAHLQGQAAAFAGGGDGGLVFLWGGSSWSGGDWSGGDWAGELLADGWLWRVPAPG